MKKTRYPAWWTVLLVLLILVSPAYSQNAVSIPEGQSEISIPGRLTTEKHGAEDWLILHGQDALTYLISGELSAELNRLLAELGDKNIVLVEGIRSEIGNLSCEKRQKYEYNQSGQKELRSEIKCLRYYPLRVTRIISAKSSDEELPKPKGDPAEEERIQALERQGATPAMPLTGEIYGQITELNFKSPLKTITVANRDQDAPLKEIALFIDGETRVAKLSGNKDPAWLTYKSLEVGQEVTVIYSKSELKNQGLLITITKD